MRIVPLILLASCYASSPPERHVVASAPRPREGYRVTPRELGDPDVLGRIHHHAWLGRRGPARFTLGGRLLRDSVRQEEPARLDPLVLVDVLGEARDALRVVSEEDDARVALWIARRDAVPTIVAPRELADATGHADPTYGVFVSPGAGIRQGTTRDGRTEVTLTDARVHASGWIDEAAIGTVWIGTRPPDEDGGSRPPPPRLPGFEVIREQPVAGARQIARTELSSTVTKRSTRNGWVEIELQRPFVRIVGWVPEAAFSEMDADYGTLGHGGGTGYGVSDTDQIDVPAGTCLYDPETDEVIGVNLVKRVRLGGWPRGEAFAHVYVNTDWGLDILRIRSGAPQDRDHPVWESCLSVRDHVD